MFKFTQKNSSLGSKAISQIFKGIQAQRFGTKKVVPSTLDNYDVVIIGSNMGAVLARHINEITNGRNTVFVASSSAIREQHHLRIAYELGSCKKENYILDTKTIITPFIPHSDGIRVKQINPESNTVILENDRTIQYKRLVISSGLQNDFEAIPGLKDAIYDQDHPAFSPYDVTGKQANVKNPYYWYNFHGGKCIFYIPKFPIRGEIQEYNFLVAYDQWLENQKNMSQKLNIEFTIVNANETFSQYSKETDEFLKEELKKRGIKVLYNTEIESLDKHQRQVTIKESDGKKVVESYDNFYSIIPSKGHEFLQNANLCNDQGLLNVDKHTLQHNKYQNIFGFGDIINVPTTRSFFGTQEQLNVVRNNLIRSLHGQSLTAEYNGESKTPLYTGKNKLTFVIQNYYKNSRYNLLDKEGKHISFFRNFLYSNFYQYINTAYYKFAIWGKPYYFFPKTYKSNVKQQKEVQSHSTEKVEKKESVTKQTTQITYKPTSSYPCNDGISAELSAKYFVIKEPSRASQTIFKAELNDKQKQEKEALENAKRAEQEQKKREQQLKREQEEKEQREREEQYRKKREQEEQEKQRQLELQRQKEEQERLQKEEQDRLRKAKLQEEEAEKLKQQQLEQQKQAELEKELEKKNQVQEEVDSAKQQLEETTATVPEEQEVAKKRKGRPKKGKKE